MHGPRPVILIAEDNGMNRETLTRRLVRHGFEISVATDGARAIDCVRNESPDLVLMGTPLPVVDGWEAIRLLKADPATCTIPVIALTARASLSDRERAREVGCDDFDTRPVDLARLLGKIRGALRLHDEAAADVRTKGRP